MSSETTIPSITPEHEAAMDAARAEQEQLDAALPPVAQKWILAQIKEHMAALSSGMFREGVYLDTLAINLFHRMATTTMDRVKRSHERVPEYKIIKSYIPGCVHVVLDDDGSPSVYYQENGSQTEDEAWIRSTEYDDDQTLRMGMVAMLAGNGVGPGDDVFILDDISIQKRTEAMGKRMQEILKESQEIETTQPTE